MKRSSRHRIRHAPPGPAGVLWEMSKSKLPKPTLGEEEEESSLRGGDENDRLFLFPGDGDERNRNDKSGAKNNRGDGQHLVSTPPAWMAMQRSLDFVTPYLPISTLGNIQKRHELLRPHLPQNCILLPEILNGKHDLKVSDPNLYLCVWVDSIEEQNSHHGIWTVDLKDETGASIRAWMEPNFVRVELQKAQQVEDTPSNKGVVRVGVVWMLTKFSIIAFNSNNNPINGVFASNNNKDGGVERMLVVSGKNIERVWTPELDKAQNQPNEEEDSPEEQRKYLEWMEKRNALNAVDEERIDCVNNDHDKSPAEEGEEMKEEELHDRCRSTFDRHEEVKVRQTKDDQTDCNSSIRHFVGGNDYQEKMLEMSGLTMTGGDENDFATSQRTATDGRSQLGMQSPVARRNVNLKDSDNTMVDSNSGHDRIDEKHQENDVSIHLHTQESCRAKNTNTTTRDESSLHPIVDAPMVASHHGCELRRDHAEALSRFDASQSVDDNHKTRSPPRISPQEHSGDSAIKKRNKKHEDRLIQNSFQNQIIDQKKQKRRRRDQNLKKSSSIRISQSIWDTQDPSILNILDDVEDKDRRAEEDEIKTVVWEESLASNFSIQSPKEKAEELEITTPEKFTENESHGNEESVEDRSNEDCDDPNCDVSQPSRGVTALGENLFKKSNWVGIDIDAFCYSDNE